MPSQTNGPPAAPKPRRIRWGLRLGAATLLLATGLLAVAAYLYLATPAASGHLEVQQGLAAKISIERDSHGVPTIRGHTIEDLAFGLGFVHAQDRL
jgi:penicillin amidase